MTSLKIQANITLSTEVCANCGMMFAMPEDLQSRFRTNGKNFYCPLGHSQWYGKSEADKVREKLNEQIREATRQTERAQRAEDAKRKAEKKFSALQKRVSHGTCPCCKRTFKQLSRHMSAKHPEYVK